ncbi:MAG: hypothetical protein A3J55_02160 [Candidatus Ryanbacteria bacterium RIFCSPHIGHO2_02_FULL_45_17b]|uniref:Uncharacterized protein n=1 Tax=Candidatus Ryanbacteria bacterium RIFCSPHIGHO2_01_FULL_45_22 TaxID=1802114 RepID=A0A1G2FYQ1_9BACT|nr:MAG: hypothetical protein A2719_00605 [Candidatus Ryanbacteria bacterium RIFCSPHIGHO2_01_FULL_45_22]OGZ46743.1 MAG: hypothetical protein A3J55_02160 [Candidatus Ryanbacteria bacterium RIFCSPHIGHO2_02_FULL_45_17b]
MCTMMGEFAKVVARQVAEGERTEYWGKDFLHRMATESILWITASLAQGKISKEQAESGLADAQKYIRQQHKE